jgi:hypothetical protein
MTRIAALLEQIGADHEIHDRMVVAAVPCEARGALRVGISEQGRLAMLQAFLMRAPDRERERVYARALAKHLQPHVWRFAIDDAGDVFLVAALPARELTAEVLDEALAALSLLVDATYEGLVRTGFDVPEDAVVVGAPPWAREAGSGQV